MVFFFLVGRLQISIRTELFKPSDAQLSWVWEDIISASYKGVSAPFSFFHSLPTHFTYFYLKNNNSEQFNIHSTQGRSIAGIAADQHSSNIKTEV